MVIQVVVKQYCSALLAQALPIIFYIYTSSCWNIDKHTGSCCTVETLCSGHHWEQQFQSLEQGVPNSGASGILPVGVVLRYRAEFSFVIHWQGRLSKDYYYD